MSGGAMSKLFVSLVLFPMAAATTSMINVGATATAMSTFCDRGLRRGDTCCAASCGSCGGPGCSQRPGGRMKCCAPAILAHRRLCQSPHEVACQIPSGGIVESTPAQTAPLLPRCTDNSAYASLMVYHDDTAIFENHTEMRTTFMTKVKGAAALTRRLRKQLHLVLVLVRSLRRVETRCRRDFVLMLGSTLTLPSAAHVVLRREHVQIAPVEPIMRGVPAADKLHAWRLLASYKRVLVVDTDVLVLRSVDDLFHADAPPFQIAHHPTELVQAQCGLPIERRGVSAFFSMTPDASRFAPLVDLLKSYPRYHVQHYSEQTMLSCAFANVSTTLPCGYLYDLASPSVGSCRHGVGTWNASAWCLRRWVGDCEYWSVANNYKTCIWKGRKRRRCKGLAGNAVCHAIGEHLQSECAWSKVKQDVRAVHFKGSIKPWLGRATQGAYCNELRVGAMTLGGSSNGTIASSATSRERVAIDDTLNWDANTGTCRSSLTGAVVHWARTRDGTGGGGRGGRPVGLQRCCTLLTMFAALWHEFLEDDGESDGGAFGDDVRESSGSLWG